MGNQKRVCSGCAHEELAAIGEASSQQREGGPMLCAWRAVCMACCVHGEPVSCAWCVARVDVSVSA